MCACAGGPEGARGDDKEDEAEPGEGHGCGGGGVRQGRRRQGSGYVLALTFGEGGCAADFSLLNLPKGKSLGRSKPATNS